MAWVGIVCMDGGWTLGMGMSMAMGDARPAVRGTSSSAQTTSSFKAPARPALLETLASV